jgi:hypothetical protein
VSNQLAELIFREGNYKELCKTLAGSLADDLHSEFIEALLKGGEGLESAQRDGYLKVYCVGIIHNIWGKKDRHKQNENGQTSPLFVYANTSVLNNGYVYGFKNEPHIDSIDSTIFDKPIVSKYWKTEEYDFTYDYKYTKAEKIIEKEKDHPDPLRMYKARVFYYSYIKYKNASEFSRKSGIPYKNVVLTCREFKRFLKNKLKI